MDHQPMYIAPPPEEIFERAVDEGEQHLNVDPDDESKLSSEVPRTDDGTSLPLDQLRPG